MDAVIESALTSLIGDGLVLDVGGGRHPYPRADVVIDKRSFGEMVGRTDMPLRVTERTWVTRDFYDFPWPFEDKQFDFCVCMHTLEDVRDPLSVAQEMQRVAKRGYISTPTRALESCRFIEDRSPLEHGLAGYSHHRWFVENQQGVLVFTPKSPLAHWHQAFKLAEVGQGALHYFWNDAFPVQENYLPTAVEQVADAKAFQKRHRLFLDGRLGYNNFWAPRLGPVPDFSRCEPYRSSRLHYHLRRFKHRFVPQTS